MSAPHEFRDPLKPDEWQEAVNMAKAYLLLDDARLYGLVTSGPEVNRARCREILLWGEARGWVPRDIEALIAQIVRGGRG